MGWKLGVMGRGKNCKDVDIQMWMRFLDENCLEVIGIGKRIENIRVGGGDDGKLERVQRCQHGEKGKGEQP